MVDPTDGLGCATSAGTARARLLPVSGDREPTRTLSTRALNRALLARQHLLERASTSVPKTIERVGGLQTQYAPAGYIALRTRHAGFRRDDLTGALHRKTVVQAWMMRTTIHMASRSDFWLFSAAVRQHRRDGWIRGFRRAASEAATAARKTARFLADGPKRRAEIVSTLGFDNATWNGVGLWLDLVRVPPFGTWEQPRADLYGLASNWLDEPPAVTEEEGTEHLVRRYLAAFGPATRADVVSFTGIPARALAAASIGSPCAVSSTRPARSCSTSEGHPCPTPTPRRRSGSSPRGTRPSSRTRDEPRSSPSATGRASSTRRPRTRSTRSSWTGRWRGAGGTNPGGS